MEIRRINIDEWEVLRDLRMRALAEDPDAFRHDLDHASGQSDAEWRDWIGSPDRGFFAAVADDGSLVAMVVGAPVDDRPGAAGLFGMWVGPEGASSRDRRGLDRFRGGLGAHGRLRPGSASGSR